MSLRQAKTQITVWSESSLCAQWVAEDPSFLHADSERLWPDSADAQADLSLRWAHTHFVGFVMSRLIFSVKPDHVNLLSCKWLLITFGSRILHLIVLLISGEISELSGKWTRARQNQPNDLCAQRRRRIRVAIRPVWSKSSLSAWRRFGVSATNKAHHKDWSDWAGSAASLGAGHCLDYDWNLCIMTGETEWSTFTQNHIL